MIKILNTNWVQSNKSDTQGNIVESFNLDLESNQRKIRTTRAKRIASGTGELASFGSVPAIVYHSNKIRVFSGIQAGDNLFDGGNSPFDAISNVPSSISCGVDDGDAISFNDELYASGDNAIESWDGTTATPVTSSLTSNTFHLLEKFTPDGNGERLYVTENNDKVLSINAANTLATSGSYTLDLGLSPDYQITALMVGENSIWIGVSSANNNAGGGKSIMIEWNGITANTPSNKYYIDASRIMSGCVKDDIPYIVDSKGRLLVFNGGVFSEIDKFPLENGSFLKTSSNLNQNAIHPKGMIADGDEILICVSNLKDGSSGTTAEFNNFPAGVWAWNPTNGLHHRLSPSYQDVADTGTTNLTDYGQYRAAFGGPIKVFETENPTNQDGGRIMFAMGYFLSGGDDLTAGTDIRYGLWTDDTHDNTQKGAFFVTPQIHSSNFRDNWNEVYVALSKLITSGDLVEVKYRFTDEQPIYATITWKDTQNLSYSSDLSDFEIGDEVQIVQGKGSGASAHIQYIKQDSSRITLDRAITGVSGTSVIRLQKWKKLTKIEDVFLESKSIGEQSDFVQFKIYAQWTGAREFYNLLVNNKSSIN